MANIFQFASSELSQDAFLCWLFSNLGGSEQVKNAYARTDDVQTYKIAKHLLLEFLKPENYDNESIEICWIEKQWNNLDIVVEVKIGKELYILGIEDKTKSYIHNANNTGMSQLKVYREKLLNFWKNENNKKGKQTRELIAKEEHIKTIVYKTSFFAPEEREEGEGWEFYDINRIIKLFNDAIPSKEKINSEILRDYYERLKLIEKEFGNETDVAEWDVYRDSLYNVCWEKFFIDLNSKLSPELICYAWYHNGTYLTSAIKLCDYENELPCIEIMPRQFVYKNKRRIKFLLRTWNVKDNKPHLFTKAQTTKWRNALLVVKPNLEETNDMIKYFQNPDGKKPDAIT